MTESGEGSATEAKATRPSTSGSENQLRILVNSAARRVKNEHPNTTEQHVGRNITEKKRSDGTNSRGHLSRSIGRISWRTVNGESARHHKLQLQREDGMGRSAASHRTP